MHVRKVQRGQTPTAKLASRLGLCPRRLRTAAGTAAQAREGLRLWILGHARIGGAGRAGRVRDLRLRRSGPSDFAAFKFRGDYLADSNVGTRERADRCAFGDANTRGDADGNSDARAVPHSDADRRGCARDCAYAALCAYSNYPADADADVGAGARTNSYIGTDSRAGTDCDAGTAGCANPNSHAQTAGCAGTGSVLSISEWQVHRSIKARLGAINPRNELDS